MIVYLLSKFITICFGMLYPAYSSYKAIKTKDAKEYVQWMMYWIVFSVYSIFEVFADAFLGCWFPFYYEIKILFMFWMLSPSTRGGSILYRRFIHPALTKHEREIDGYLADAKRTTGNMVTRWGSRALSYVTDSFVRIVLRAPHLAQEYVQRSPSRRPLQPAGYQMYSEEEYPNYPNNDNMMNSSDSPYYETDATDGFSSSPNLMHAGRSVRHPNEMPMNGNDAFLMADSSPSDNRTEMNPNAIPPAGLRGNARGPRKLKSEFGNFSMVTAQDGSMNKKPIIFGWYPYSETPAVYAPDISSGVIPSVFPSVIPTVPFLNSQEMPLSSDSSISSSKTGDATVSVESKPVEPVETSPTDEFADPLTSEEHSVDDFFDCEEVEKEGKGKESTVSKPTTVAIESKPTVVATEGAVSKPAVSPNIKVVGKTNLQAFDEKSSSGKMNPKKSVDNLARHSSSESLAAVKRKTASLTSLSKLDKTKARKSFSGTESKPKVALFSSQSFRRVLHPFVSSKSLTSSHSSKNVSRSTTSVDASKETKPDKS